MTETLEQPQTPTEKELFDGITYLKKHLPLATNQTLRVFKVGTSYRVNWYEPVETGLKGLVSLKMVKSRFITLEVVGKDEASVRELERQ